jgi:hypothetical protein
VAVRPQITEADQEVLQFLAEHRTSTGLHVAHLLGVSPETADRRLRLLSGRGYAVRDPIFEGHPPAVWITRAGLNAIESRLPTPRLDLRGYRHDLALGWLWLAARDGAFGPLDAIHSEREMRSRDRRADRAGPEAAGEPRFGVGLGGVGPRGGPLRHYPDLLLHTDRGHTIALELELTPKSTRRLDGIMRGFAGDARIDKVAYLVPDARLGEKVASAARRAGIRDLVSVQRLVPASPAGAPDPGRTVTRPRSAARTAEASR